MDAEGEHRQGLLVASVVENRSREVCVCTMDTRNRTSVEVLIISDSHSYTETMLMLNQLEPDEILLPDGTQSKVLTEKLLFHFGDSAVDQTRIVFISRQYFDQDRGAQMLKNVASGEVDADLLANYMMLAGCYGLLRYIENCSGCTFQHNGLRVIYSSRASLHLHIDRHTAVNLELICDQRTGNQKESLFGALNHTKTAVGARLLKSNILRPLTDIPSINARLDFVELLLQSPQIFNALVQVLPLFPDLDRCLTGLTTTPKLINVKSAAHGIETLIMLKTTIKLSLRIGALLQELLVFAEENGKPPCILLEALAKNLNEASLTEVSSMIDDSLTDSTQFSKNVIAMRENECFALQSGLNTKLDIARITFIDSVEQIYAYATDYSALLNTPVKVTFTISRGYFLQVPAPTALPPEFIRPVAQRKTIQCTTHEVSSLSDRAQESLATCLVITNDLLQLLIQEIRQRITVLFTMVDSIALTDVLLSFADLPALSALPYTRPQLTSTGPLVIRQGRHPIVENIQKQHFIENDTFLSELNHFTLITGCNGAGKSVYLKQVAILVIIAQIGCYVPASHLTCPIRDRILSRIGTNDDVENNLSTFFVEMKDSAYILANLTDRSLVLVDELGRGTSNIDGISLAFAIAESLIQSQAYVLFVTHFSQLTALSGIYPAVKNMHLKAQVDFDSHDIKYLHSVEEGPCLIKSGYGIIMAELCHFPQELIVKTQRIQSLVRDKFINLMQFPVRRVDQSLSVITALLQKTMLLKGVALDAAGLRTYLSSLVAKLTPLNKTEIIDLLTQFDMASLNTNSLNAEESKASDQRVAVDVSATGAPVVAPAVPAKVAPIVAPDVLDSLQALAAAMNAEEDKESSDSRQMKRMLESVSQEHRKVARSID